VEKSVEVEERVPIDKSAKYFWALARLVLGWIFLFAFLDKLFGLGFGTPAADAWIRGGSPTAGYLLHGTTGPLENFYHMIAGKAVVDWLYMFALLGLGVSLPLGIFMHLAGVGGALFVTMLWTTELPKATNPFADKHMVYFFVLLGLMASHAGRTWGLGRWWSRVVGRLRFLE
jgi:thiosulfate dehydrogenase [quinone] large subunit